MKLKLTKPQSIELAVLSSLFLFSLIFTSQNLSQNPAGFFTDEAVSGYEAYKILKTGRDSHGYRFPLFFKGLANDNISPLSVYPIVPFVYLLGLNEFSVRLTSVFWASFEVVFFYLLLKELIKKEFALIGVVFLITSPWHFHLSRIEIAGIYSWTLLTTLSYFLLIKGLKTGSHGFLIASSFALGVTSYSYLAARLITPIIFFVTTGIVFIMTKNLKLTLLMTAVFFITLIPFIHHHLTFPGSFQRIKETVGIDLRQGRVTEPIEGGFINHFLRKYPTHFSNDFLFKNGDADYPGQFMKRHSIEGLGLFFSFQKWLMAAGLIWVTLQVVIKKRLELLVIIALIPVFPLADSITREATPFATRSYVGILPLMSLATFGVLFIYEVMVRMIKIKTMHIKNLVLFSSILTTISSSLILLNKFKQSPLTSSDFWGWQYGPREIMTYFLSVKNQYDELFMSGEFNGSEIFIPFYDPENKCQSKCLYGDLWRTPEIVNPNQRQLFSFSPQYLLNSGLKDRFVIKKIINYPNAQPAFLIGELKS